MLAPLALTLGTIVLAALLVGRGRRLAAGGAGLLAFAALFHLDMALASHTPSSYWGQPGSLFSGAFTGTPSLATVPALTSAAELAGYLLLVAGLRVAAVERAQPGGPNRRIGQ